MQSYIKISLLSFMLLFAVSCGSKVDDGGLQKKKEKLEAYKKEQAELLANITKLEADIAKLDTTKKPENSKLVILDTIELENFTHYIDLQGKVDAQNISYISPRGQGGQVRAVYVTQGQLVHKGQLLLKLDDAVQRQSLNTAKQSIAAIRNQLELAKSLYQRTKNLWDQQIGTEVQLIQARTNVEVLENQVKTQQENVKLVEEQLNMANVVSNVSGVADVVNIHVGEMFTGSPLMGIKIVNNTNLKIVTNVPENYLAKVSKGTPVIVSVPDIGKTYNSTVSLIGQDINSASRGFIAEAKVPNDKALKPNLTAMVRIQDYMVPNAVTIPVNIIQTDDAGKFVLVDVKEGSKKIAKKRPVVIGELYGDKLEIKSGLQSGDVIITEGFQALYDGQTIITKV